MIKKLKKINWKSIVERALHTFIQGFLATMVITGFSNDEIKATLIGALAGGLSALKTFILELLKEVEE